MSSSKKILRKAVLSALRAVPQPTRDAESAAVCDALWTNVIAPIVYPPRLQKPSGSSGGTGDLIHRVAVLAYLPMYYELSLLPLMHRAWAFNKHQEEQATEAAVVDGTRKPVDGTSSSGRGSGSISASSHHRVDIYVPHMLPLKPPTVATPDQPQAVGGGGEMMFVHVRDADDLALAFTPRGKLNILELTHSEEEALLRSVRRRASTYFADANSGEAAAAPPPVVCGANRQFICMSSTAAALQPTGANGRLLPQHPTQKAEAVLTNGTEGGDASADCIVVLTPAAAYDAVGGRLGKGGGFYDNFLRRLRSALPTGSSPTTASMEEEASGASVRIVGVALSSQVLTDGASVEALLHAQGSLNAAAPAAVDSSTDVPLPAADRLSPLRIECRVPTATAVDPRQLCSSGAYRIPTDAWDEPVDEIMTVARGA